MEKYVWRPARTYQIKHVFHKAGDETEQSSTIIFTAQLGQFNPAGVFIC